MRRNGKRKERMSCSEEAIPTTGASHAAPTPRRDNLSVRPGSLTTPHIVKAVIFIP
jgi:hypothetical protein